MLTKDEIARVFALYPKCPTRIYDSPDGEAVADYLQAVTFESPSVSCDFSRFEVDEVKLVLNALHHLNSEQVLLACRAYNNIGFMYATHKNIEVRAEGIYRRVYIQGCPFSYAFETEAGNVGVFKDGRQVFDGCSPTHLTQHYLIHNVAIPLYFGYGHKANGLTAIALGIAEPRLDFLNDLLLKKLGDKQAVQEWYFDQKLHGNDLTRIEMVDTFIKELSNE